MDPENLRNGLMVLNMVGTLTIGAWMYLQRRSDRTDEHVTALLSRVDKIESAMIAAPTHADLARLYESVNQLAGTVNQLVGENRGQTDTLRLILNRITEKGLQ